MKAASSQSGLIIKTATASFTQTRELCHRSIFHSPNSHLCIFSLPCSACCGPTISTFSTRGERNYRFLFWNHLTRNLSSGFMRKSWSRSLEGWFILFKSKSLHPSHRSTNTHTRGTIHSQKDDSRDISFSKGFSWRRCWSSASFRRRSTCRISLQRWRFPPFARRGTMRCPASARSSRLRTLASASPACMN